MKCEGWIFMIVSWSVAIGIFIFCLRRTLRPRPNNNNNAQPPEHKPAEQPPQSETPPESPAQG